MLSRKYALDSGWTHLDDYVAKSESIVLLLIRNRIQNIKIYWNDFKSIERSLFQVEVQTSNKVALPLPSGDIESQKEKLACE